jgi:antitoxin CptB
MDLDPRRRRLKFRAWHRGTREADYMIGGFFDRHHATWGEPELAWFEALLEGEPELAWFEALLEEDDVDVMAWALGTQPVPQRYAGAQMEAMQRLDYVEINSTSRSS